MKDLKYNSFPKYGATVLNQGVLFRFVSQDSNCGIIFFDLESGAEMSRIPFSEEERMGIVYSKIIEGLDFSKLSYAFYCGENILADQFALAYVNRWDYGTMVGLHSLKASIPVTSFDWGKDQSPRLPFSEVITYCMHVRGFTKDASSGVKAPGTFQGIREKLSYLRGIGITAIELQPAYEFIEFAEPEPAKVGMSIARPQEKVNYWGYTNGLYYAPKANYAMGEPTSEFKSLVKDLHAKGMELYMQFYFTQEMSKAEILSILTFWVQEYHVDGFRLMGNGLPMELITKEPLLADTKLFTYRFEDQAIPEWKKRNICASNDDYCLTVRRFLKGDEGLANSTLYHMRHIDGNQGNQNYVSNYCGFTLADMVAYDQKHNEENGEENRDGSDYNCSWNCGEEGPTKSRRIQQLRLQQMKNAFAFLLLSQGTPMIFMGDEFGNTQKGNNNPYCQDNEITWLDWKLQKKNAKLLHFWKEVVALRKEHSILRPERELLLMDRKSCGYPDLSYHGESAWKPDQEHYVRHFGIMFAETYADTNPVENFLYVGVNMHWDEHTLALPKLPKDMVWCRLLCTAEQKEVRIEEDVNTFSCPARSICVYGTKRIEKEVPKKRKAVLKKQDE